MVKTSLLDGFLFNMWGQGLWEAQYFVIRLVCGQANQKLLRTHDTNKTLLVLRQDKRLSITGDNKPVVCYSHCPLEYSRKMNYKFLN